MIFFIWTALVFNVTINQCLYKVTPAKSQSQIYFNSKPPDISTKGFSASDGCLLTRPVAEL